MKQEPCERCILLMEVLEKLSASFADSCKMLREANKRIFNEENNEEEIETLLYKASEKFLK